MDYRSIYDQTPIIAGITNYGLFKIHLAHKILTLALLKVAEHTENFSMSPYAKFARSYFAQ